MSLFCLTPQVDLLSFPLMFRFLSPGHRPLVIWCCLPGLIACQSFPCFHCSQHKQSMILFCVFLMLCIILFTDHFVPLFLLFNFYSCFKIQKKHHSPKETRQSLSLIGKSRPPKPLLNRSILALAMWCSNYPFSV